MGDRGWEEEMGLIGVVDGWSDLEGEEDGKYGC